MNRRFGFSLLVCSLLIVACRPDLADKTEKSPLYNQDFKTDVAWVALEWNGKPTGYGSGFLIDKGKGYFYTNKHVTNVFNSLGSGSHKIFFNGRVYNAVSVQSHPLADISLVRITDPFDFSEFPDPAPVSGKELKVGDRVIVEGFHPHPYSVREADLADGFRFPLLSIFGQYYGMATKDKDEETEIVFERLEATVSEIDKKIKIGEQGSGTVQDLRNMTNLYIEIKTGKDHRFSFGGLSGTVVRNMKGETVGIFTAGPTLEYDPETKHDLPDGGFVAARVFKTAYITPIRFVSDLSRHIK